MAGAMAWRGGMAGRRFIAAVAAAVLLSGCAGHGAGGQPRVTVALDFVPNAVHAPIFTAEREGDDRRHGLRIVIQRPGSQPDSLKAVVAGRADVGVLDIHDLGLARERGKDVVAIGALVERPLAALIAQRAIRRPRDLGGRTVGVSGLPSDPAFLRAIVRHDGGDYASIRQVTIGFNAVSALLTHRVDACRRSGTPRVSSCAGVACPCASSAWRSTARHRTPRWCS
jgi:putative hydroxymethylpyrimidine transport system substrate-binding protein